MFSRRDRVIVAALVFLLGVVWLLARPGGRDRLLTDRKLSSFRTSPDGARALYLTLQELDVPTSRRLRPYAGGEAPAGRALALLAPTEPPSPLELTSLHTWIRSGGTLLYAARPGDPSLDSLGLSLESLAPDTLSLFQRPDWEGVGVRPRPHRWTGDLQTRARARRAFADSSEALSSRSATPLLVTPGGKVAVLTFRRGHGTVVAWSDPALLSNRALREGVRPLVFARAAAAVTSDGDSLVFDEYHHGHRAGGGPVRATLRFLRDTGPGRAALQLAVAGLGLLFLLGRRFGSPVELQQGRRRSPLEHVEALSAAYQRAGARDTARRLLIAGLARRLDRKVPEDVSETTFLERLADHLPAGGAEARLLLAEWKKGDRADLTELARRADAVASAARARIHPRPNGDER